MYYWVPESYPRTSPNYPHRARPKSPILWNSVVQIDVTAIWLSMQIILFFFFFPPSTQEDSKQVLNYFQESVRENKPQSNL